MNTGQRSSEAINPSQALNLLGAGYHAHRIGRPLNRSVTVHCARAGVDMVRVHDFITCFLKLASDWLRYNTADPPYYVWVLEAPPHRGLHLHLLIHVPERLRPAYLRLQRRWLTQAGAKRKNRVLRSKRIWCSRSNDDSEYLDRGLGGCLSYLLKGSEAATSDAYHLRHSHQGVIIGKRCGTSQALGEKARRGGASRP